VLNTLWKDRLKQWTKEFVSMGLLIFIIANVFSYFRSPNLNDTNLPEISTLLTNKELFSTQDFTNKPVLIHFWAMWCPTCKLEASNIQKLSESYNVLSIAVRSGSDAEINAYLKENDFNFNVINDHKGILASKFHVQAYPTTFIYNKQNTLSFSEVGYTSTWGLYLRMWWANQ